MSLLVNRETSPLRLATSADVHEMSQVLMAFAELAGRNGTPTVAFTGAWPRHFAVLPPKDQACVLKNFRTYASICHELAATGVSLRDDRQLLWCMIKRLGLRPSSGLFGSLSNEDVIEVYDGEGMVQVFRNMKFYDVSSYSLDDIVSRPWYELYRRDPSVMDKIQMVVERAIRSGSADLLYYETGIHEMEEIDSPLLNRSLIENRFLAPLLDQRGRAQAFVNVVRPISIMRGRGVPMPQSHSTLIRETRV